MKSPFRSWFQRLSGCVVLLVAPAALAEGEACFNDTDCPGAACGDAVCNWNKPNPNATAEKPYTCNPAGTDVKGLDGWCTTTDNCKCKAEGASCLTVHCLFTRTSDAPVGAAGAGGADAVGAGGADTAGEGGAPSAGDSNALGRACKADLDCRDPKAPGLTCITETQTLLENGAPPHGLCTSACDTDDDCFAFGSGAICYPFSTGLTAGYCIEGCSFGAPFFGEQKCHDRPEMACNPALLGKTGAVCQTTANCASGELCTGGTCNVVFPGCLPACRGDIDCAAGMYCDQSFLSGVCTTRKPVGKALGEPCTVKDEPDECLGFCQADVEGIAAGHCATTCGLARECAWNADSQVFDGLCFYASVLTTDFGDTGDFGFCTPSCRCSSECHDPSLQCEVVTGLGRLSSSFRGPGLCFQAEPGVDALDECPATPAGAAGAGGASDGSAGASSSAGGAETALPDASDGGAGESQASGSPDDSSCGCRIGARSEGSWRAAWLLALALAFGVRRRERARARAVP